MEKIKRMSRILSGLFLISCVIYPIIEILYAYYYPNHLFDPTVQSLFNSGLVILTVSWIMSEANRLQDEEIHTV
jgi:uncharacterized membrane protein YGL010W